MSKKSTKKERVVYRDAKTGRFVTEDYAKRNAETTVKETVQTPKKRQ